jgi:hypothetical protein
VRILERLQRLGPTVKGRVSVHRRVMLAFVSLLALPPLRPAVAAETRAFVTTTDYSSGGLRRIDLNTRAVLPGEAPASTDTRLRWYGGQVVIVNRFGKDNIQVVDPATLATVRQISTGNGSNPADIAFASPTKAYVALYERADLLIVDPQTGATLGNVALAGFADADGIPEMDHMEMVGPLLFVALQRLDRAHGFTPTDSSLVVVVDTRADTVLDVDPAQPGRQGFRLTGKNPVTPFLQDPETGRLLIGCAGSYGALDGGIEWIDPVGMRSLGYAITETALGGNLSGIAWYTAAHSYAVVYDASFNGLLVSWSATTGSRLATIFSATGLNDLGIDDRNELYACDGTFTSPGVRVWAAGSDVPLAGPLDTDLPPSQITFDGASATVPPVEPTPAGLSFAPPWPNPAREAARFDLDLPHAGDLDLEVFDLAGRRVRVLASGPRPAGAASITWDLLDGAGTRVVPGVYLVRARLGGAQATSRIAVMR